MKRGSNKAVKPWLFKPGQSGNPNGRPRGTYGVKKRFALALQVLNYPLKYISPKAFNELKKTFPKMLENITIDEALMLQTLDATLNTKTVSPVFALQFLRNEAYGKLPEGEEPKPDDAEEDKFVINVVIEEGSLKSDNIE